MRILTPTLLLVVAACNGEPKVTDTPPEPSATPAPYTPPDCSNYTDDISGAVYNCDNLDPCAGDFSFQLACCNCDVANCNPPPPGTCPDDGPDPFTPPPPAQIESCMACHNGATVANDYGGAGIGNPHPFRQSGYITCSQCHGGNPDETSKDLAHVPRPPELGNQQNLINSPHAYFNYLTVVGIDKFPDYTGADGNTYASVDWLRFRNPGDLRVVSAGYSCGSTGCHGGEHSDWVSRYPIATEVGFYSATLYTSGVANAVPENQGLYFDTAGDYGFRYISDPNYTYSPTEVGRVGKLLEFPEYAQFGQPGSIWQNPVYDANQLANYVYDGTLNGTDANQVITGSPLEHLVTEIIAQGCGDCHLGHMGANNRYADFRSSGCTSCHMEYSPDGRSRSTDQNVNKYEPANPDAIAAPERPHVDSHQIRNVAKVLPNGAFVRGISDNACVGCHQGSNRTVLQFWGVRLDQNQDVVNNLQYPANPVNFTTGAADTRLYDPAVQNATFNGRIAEQLLIFEDYDGDNRNDIPMDVHYEAGMGCIDCHSSYDVHGGTAGSDRSGWIHSREDQALGVQCESCHGRFDPAPTVTCTDYDGNTAECAADIYGNAMRNVTVDVNGEYWLRSRLNGQLHYVPQTIDSMVQNNKRHPLTNALLYSPLASYAMGNNDGNPATGVGPQQDNYAAYGQGFSHLDSMTCVTCHAAWQNNCMGCHLEVQYNDNPANYFFSNTTGERITLNFAADFVYQSPVQTYLMVGSRNEVDIVASGMKMFFRYDDLNGNESNVFAFSDRNGNGNNPATGGRGNFGALAHNKISPHSIRGKVSDTMEGPRYCVNCHLTTDALDNFGAEYAAFKAALENDNFADLDFDLLQEHIGQNPGNQLNSPIWVYMVSGQGSGLFLFDANGCPVNPLDANANRQYCDGVAPADAFDANTVNDVVVYNLDRIVEFTGVANASNGHPMLDGTPSLYRTGARTPGIAGPLGLDMLERLTNENSNQAIILDSWIDANGAAGGNAANYIQF